MKITICSSLSFHKKVLELGEKLKSLGHEALIPLGVEQFEQGGLTPADVEAMKNNGSMFEFVTKYDLISKHFSKIENSDAILVVNEEKRKQKNYIGANTFLEWA